MKATRDTERSPSHPGELLDEIIPATGRSKMEIAGLLGISRQHLHAILSGRKPVSPDVAARLGKLFGDGAAVWLRMQAAHGRLACRTRRRHLVDSDDHGGVAKP